MEYYVYIIASSSTGKFYTGMTSDFIRRLYEHNSTIASTHTTCKLHDYHPIFVQITNNRQDARKLEKYLKSGVGREFRSEIVKYSS
jgi:putative endonuclease